MKKYRLKIWGDFACFTRPEMKVERVSYDIITPSAARAVFETILWKPAIQWHIDKIEVLNPIQWINFRRNEIKSKTSLRSNAPLYIEEDRIQRSGLFLKDVSYIIEGYFEVLPEYIETNPRRKFEEMFERRASQGQCFMQPYFGCREFTAYFQLLQNEHFKTITETRDLGWMFYDFDYVNKEINPRFFKAMLQNGVMKVPSNNSLEVRG